MGQASMLASEAFCCQYALACMPGHIPCGLNFIDYLPFLHPIYPHDCGHSLSNAWVLCLFAHLPPATHPPLLTTICRALRCHALHFTGLHVTEAKGLSKLISEAHRTHVMTTADGKRYRCRLPPLATPQDEEEGALEVAAEVGAQQRALAYGVNTRGQSTIG